MVHNMKWLGRNIKLSFRYRTPTSLREVLHQSYALSNPGWRFLITEKDQPMLESPQQSTVQFLLLLLLLLLQLLLLLLGLWTCHH